MIVIIVLTIVSVLVTIFNVYSTYKLNLYISKLEESHAEQIKLTGNLRQSLKEIVAEDFLLNDGRLKKFLIQKEKNVYFNGATNENTYEL